jgi:hypothetical protein
MLKAFMERLQQQGDLKSFFYMTEAVMVLVFLGLVWILRPKDPESNFKVREADLRKGKAQPRDGKSDPLAEARIQLKQPLQLEGIRIDGQPHEVLGVNKNSSPIEIQQAYRELMKRYHPDRVGPPGTRQWNDAQKIAEAINHAKDVLLKKK